MKTQIAIWTLAAIMAIMACGCQFETVNVTIDGGGGGHTLHPAIVKYGGDEATAANVFIIKIDRSPTTMGQTQEDVGSGNEASATGL